jgi:hypothetical protein
MPEDIRLFLVDGACPILHLLMICKTIAVARLVKTFPLKTFKRLNVQTFLDVLTQVTMAIQGVKQTSSLAHPK